MQQNASILIAAAFAMIGFALGRVTAPHCGHPMNHDMHHHMQWLGEGSDGEDIQVLVRTLEADGFMGDTTLAIPGGQVRVIKSGDEVEVEVEMDTEETTGPGEVVVKKRVVVTSSDED